MNRDQKKRAALIKTARFFHNPQAATGGFPAVRSFRKVKFICSGGIIYRDAMVFMFAPEEGRISLMHVAMDHDSRAVPVQQGTETLEPAV